MNQEEENLRNNIRQLIRHVKQKRLDEEQQIRDSLKTLMRLELHNMLSEAETPDQDPAPNKSTGINVLEDLLKKIVPVFKDDFRLLTTNEEQRKSFRAHIVKAIVDTLTPVDVNNDAEQPKGSDEPEEFEEEEIEVLGLNEVIDIEIISDEPDNEKFIDIRSDKEIADEEGEEEEEDPRDEFGKGLEDLDTTGRNMAYNTFKKVQTNIIDAYELLDDPEDQELFYDYLIANVKLYFDKFEDELETNVEEPTNQAYQDAKAEQEPQEAEGNELEGLFEISLD
tara:strand:+ start:2858 stop:3700 length:843 start_codon:yes stop_codon:yes gene_type:complete